MNDKAYEQGLDTLQQEMLLVLDELHNDPGTNRLTFWSSLVIGYS